MKSRRGGVLLGLAVAALISLSVVKRADTGTRGGSNNDIVRFWCRACNSAIRLEDHE